MPKLVGVRERRHQPFWDTLFRANAATATSPTVAATTKLFSAGTNLSNPDWTNMNQAGSLPSDNTFIILSIRCWLFFHSTNAMLMYVLTSVQLFLNLFVGDKPQFHAPCWYFPGGGGTWAWDSATPVANNGVPSQESILKLAKPIPVPARQHFYVEATMYDIGTTSVRTQYINSSTSNGVRECKVLLDGIHTRDVL